MNLFENLQMMKESENNVSYNKYKSMITQCINRFNSKIEKVQQKVEYLIDNNLLNDFIFKNHPHSEDVLNEIKESGSDVSTITSLLLMWDSLVEMPIDIYIRSSDWAISEDESKINLDDWLYFSIYNYYQEDYDDIRENYMSDDSFIDKELYENELTMFNNANVMMDKLLNDVIIESNNNYNNSSINNKIISNSKLIQILHNRLIKLEDVVINYFVNNYDCDKEDVSQELCNNIYFLPEFEHISDNIDGLKYDYFEDDAKNYLKELEQPDVYPGRPSKEEYLKQQLMVIKELKELINEIY